VSATDVVQRLGGPGPRAPGPVPFLVVRGDENRSRIAAFRALRRRAFVEEQGLFAGDDGDEHDGAAHTVVLVAVAADGVVLGGVRLHPEGDDAGLGWWRGSRLVCSPAAGAAGGRVAAALVRSARMAAIDAGALRFDAHVQDRHVAFFSRLGWQQAQAAGEVCGCTDG